MVRVRYGGLRDPKALFEELRPLRRKVRDVQDQCRPFGPDYMILGGVVAALGIVVPDLRNDRARYVAALQVAAQGIGRALAARVERD